MIALYSLEMLFVAQSYYSDTIDWNEIFNRNVLVT